MDIPTYVTLGIKITLSISPKYVRNRGASRRSYINIANMYARTLSRKILLKLKKKYTRSNMEKQNTPTSSMCVAINNNGVEKC